MFEAEGFVERGRLAQHLCGFQIAALVTEGACLVQCQQHQPSTQPQPAQGGHEVHLLQLADLILFPRQRRYAAAAEDGAIRPFDHPVAAHLPQIGLVQSIEVRVGHPVALVGGEAVFGGDGAHHGGDMGIVGGSDGTDAVALLTAGTGEGAAVETQAGPQLLTFAQGELGQGLFHGAVHLLMQHQ